MRLPDPRPDCRDGRDCPDGPDFPDRPADPPRRRWLAAGLLAATALHPAQARAADGRVWRVGPGLALTRVADALHQAGDGDTVQIMPGTYPGDVAVIGQRRLTIIGLGQRPLLRADGRHAEGKAIWVVDGGDIHISNIAFSGARVPDGNGAGIRLQAGRLHLHRCAFADHQMGLLTGDDAACELHISDCDFSDAPANPGTLPHLLYVGRIGHFSLHGSRLWNGRDGHLVKSRARQSTLVGNLIDDGALGTASYEIDLPNGGIAYLEGNTVVQRAGSQNPVMLAYGAEGAPWAENRLTLRRNTFVNHLPAGGWFVRVWADRLPPGTAAHSEHNQFLGPGSLLLGPLGQSNGDGRGPAPPDQPNQAGRSSGITLRPWRR